MEEIADHWNVDTAATEQELSEGTFIDTNVECSSNERMKMSQRTWCHQVSPLRKLSDTCHDFDGAKNKMLEDDPDFKRRMTIHQDIEKMLVPYHNLYDKKANAIQTTIDNFLKKWNILIPSASNVLN